MSRQDFIKDISKYAQELGKEYNILTSLIMGVACHESNFGESQLAKLGNNLFAVKGKYNGESVNLPTWEVENGVRYDINADFRKYPTYRESMKDFCELIKNGVSWNKKIYHSVIGVKDWKEAITLFAKTPYMTDPDYKSKLTNITSQYKLYEYNEDQEEKTSLSTGATITDEEDKEVPKTDEPIQDDSDTAQQKESQPKATPDETATAGTAFIKFPGYNFSMGSKGNYVKMIQEKLDHGLKVDGNFGSLTRAYTMVYQNENNLNQDGIVGEATWNSLINGK